MRSDSLTRFAAISLMYGFLSIAGRVADYNQNCAAGAVLPNGAATVSLTLGFSDTAIPLHRPATIDTSAHDFDQKLFFSSHQRKTALRNSAFSPQA